MSGLFGGGGGGGGSQQGSTTVNNGTLPAYLQPYVENMLNATQAQVYEPDMSTFRPYQPYSNNPQDYVAGFSPMQQQSFNTAANLQTPGQYNTATDLATLSGLGALGTTQGAQMYGQRGVDYGGAAAGMAPQAQQYGAEGSQIGTEGGLRYGDMGVGLGQQAAGLAGNAMGYGQTGANIGTAGGLGYGAAGMQAGQAGAGYGAMGAQQGASYGQNAQNAQAVQGYMNPYLRATLDPAMQLQNQQFGMINAQNQGQATQQGAFGGGRQAVTQGLNQQNQMLAQNQLTSNAYNQAYNVANQNMQNAASLGMQGAGLGIQGQNAAMQGAGLGLQGVNAAMAGQQLGLSGVTAANQAYQTGLQGVNAGLQGVNTAMAGKQLGLQGLNQAGSLYGLGIQGAQTGLAGIAAQQAGYANAGQQATNLANIGGQQLGATQNIAQLQNLLGSQQQQQQQNIINQNVQNYATAQQYPYMQLGMLSNMIHGLPMQASTTQNYSALPTTSQQLLGGGIGALGAYKAFGP
jgi:hypothetical protein